jgi:Spy/CpxP family protein refolding chaperone
MKTFGKMVLACGMVALIAAPAMAQGGRGFGGGMGGGSGAMLLSNKSVQGEIKATSEQVEKLNALGEKLMTKQREEGAKLRDLDQAERMPKQQELNRTMMAEVKTGITEILKPEQVKRFEQLQLQQTGVNAFTMMPRVSEGLKLTDEQKTKIRDLNQEFQPKIREAMQGFQDDREAAMKKMAEVRKEQTEKVMAVLTAEQRTSYKEMTGEPFEIKMEPPRPRN